MSNLFDKFAAEEEAFFGSTFMAPVLRGQPILVRISGITMTLKVRPKNFEGWGVFRSNDQRLARRVREATLSEKREYLDIWPRLSLVVCHQGDKVLGVPATDNDPRFKIQGFVPIALPEEVRVFDTVDVRFDGKNMWFDGQSSFRNARFADQLRNMLAEETEPDKVEISGLSSSERAAYKFAYDAEIESKRDRKEDRLRYAVERSGAQFRSYTERGNTYTVEMMVDGRTYRPVLDKETLTCTSSGICLSGGDRAFDLQSLVGVFREGQDRRLIYEM